MFRIEADLLIPGRGEPVKNGCVVIEGSAISYAGPVEGAPKTPSGFRTVHAPAVMPGMWDCHGRFIGIRTANIEEMIRTPVLPLRDPTAGRSRARIREHLARGRRTPPAPVRAGTGG